MVDLKINKKPKGRPVDQTPSAPNSVPSGSDAVSLKIAAAQAADQMAWEAWQASRQQISELSSLADAQWTQWQQTDHSGKSKIEAATWEL
ncbi:Uncharacterised protein [Mycobacteroides abscessus subsp. abscessus]|nr:Uncharacterised protein [Mycobacteroides abscessus subsp. abscessus]